MKLGESANQDQKTQRVAYLITGYIRKTLTVAEQDELDKWIEARDANMQLFEELTDEKHIQQNIAWMQKLQTNDALLKTKRSIGFEQHEQKKFLTYLWPCLVAASLVSVIVLSFLFFDRSGTGRPYSPEQMDVVRTDVPPGGNRATLRLSDGRIIDLNQSDNGVLKTEAGSEVNKSKDGELVYSASGDDLQAVVYHTLSTPKGGQYMLTLADGSKVWLNAASSIYFPSQFTGSERIVKITGEAYFEVAKNASKPFIVQLPDDNKIRVLGTHFVASSYANEGSQEVTLEEGSVEVTANTGKMVKLQPGQQASISSSSLSVNKDVDMEAALGFVNGNFVLRNADIQTIMRQIERWYDVKIVYRTSTSEHFNATISRSENVSQLLHLLELTGKINFNVKNNTIYVLP